MRGIGAHTPVATWGGRMFTRCIVLLTVLLLTVSAAHAEMYQWVDEKGVVTFKDTPPPKSKKLKKVKAYHDDDFAAAPPASPSQPAPKSSGAPPTTKVAAATPAQKKFTGTVELYVTSWCGYCKKAQSYLTAKGVPYIAYDIEKDSAAKKRHAELGGDGVPLIIIGSHKISGFSPEAIDHYLKDGN